MKNFISSVFLVMILAHSAIAQSVAGMLAVGAKLTEGQRLYSPNKSHYLTMQPDGNLCIYTSSDKFVWCSMATKGSGSYLTMQADGNLVVNDRDNQAAWSTETQAYFDPKYGTGDWKPVRAMLNDDGLLGLYTDANELVWNNAMGKLDIPVAVAVTPATEPVPVEGYTGPTERKQMNIVLPRSKTAQNIEVEIADGKVIYQSDMILGDVGDFTSTTAPSNDAASNDDQSRRWPNSTIPYVLPAGHPKRDIILAGIKEVHDKTNLCVVPRTNQTDYVEFVSKNGNWSVLGKSYKGGRQEISITQANQGTVVHEILHAAGFVHAQSREDRDTYVTISFGNIQAGKEHNFQKQDDKATNIGAYDFSSVMHYPAKAFSKNNQNTINLKNAKGDENSVMGQRDGLSAGDIAAVATLYVPGSCKPAGANIVASNTGKPTTTSPQTPTPTVTTTTPTPPQTRPTGTETDPAVRTRPTSTETNTPVRTRPTETSNPAMSRTTPVDNAAILRYRGQMKPGDRLQEGEKMVSPNGKFQLRGTPDGNFVIEEIPSGLNVYTFPLSNPFGEGVAKGYLSYNPDGNICIQSSQNKSYCATNGRDAVAPVILHKSIRAELTDDGRLRLVAANGEEIWATAPPATTPSRQPQTGTPTAMRTGQPQTETPTAMRTGQPQTETPSRIRQGKTAEPITDGRKPVPIPGFTPSAVALDNLALLPIAKTWQSYGDNTQFSNSQKAIDGNKNRAYLNGPANSVSQTPPSLTPAWQVDLGQLAEVDHIVIWNSSEASNLAGRNFYVTTGAEEIHSRPATEPLAPDNPGYDSDVFGRDASSGRVESLGPYRWEADQTSFVIPINRTTRKIRISLQKQGLEMTPLSLTEVEVYGKPYVGRRR
ncbi:M12 family metallopeptidase [Persicitalea jodogahamensis]|uniref:Metalloendopeptidase n=1 Tax=Persicitalea jodogahamensis TaxID=402147 RepID=A0A8J3D173_9BACT|nr:M12 family metallopeptidase [Persicitalea jodogahamensis]GHB62193.1 hypothetical protein GCM10007390_14940 [Persicitalea jodogahamensis]